MTQAHGQRNSCNRSTTEGTAYRGRRCEGPSRLQLMMTGGGHSRSRGGTGSLKNRRQPAAARKGSRRPVTMLNSLRLSCSASQRLPRRRTSSATCRATRSSPFRSPRSSFTSALPRCRNTHQTPMLRCVDFTAIFFQGWWKSQQTTDICFGIQSRRVGSREAEGGGGGEGNAGDSEEGWRGGGGGGVQSRGRKGTKGGGEESVGEGGPSPSRHFTRLKRRACSH